MEELYKEERELLQRLTESTSIEEQQLLKRMIGRLNNEMESLDC